MTDPFNAYRPRSVSLVQLCCVALLGVAVGACSEDAENNPPTVVLNPDGPDLNYTIGDTVFIKVLAQDPDNDPLSFRYTWRTTNTLSTLERTATFIPSTSEATLSWTPDSSDVTPNGQPLELIFIVKDSRGAEVQRKLNVSIVPGNGAPRFESSANQIYRNCCDEPLSFEVKVRDDDSEQVTLSVSSPLQGATFEQTGAKKGRFTWTPSPTQAQQRIHTTKFTVDDGQNPPAFQDMTIVIYSGSTNPVDPSEDICKGEQAIEHTPLQAQRGPSLKSFPISGKLSAEAAARYDRAAVSWTATRDPVRDPSASLGTVDLTLEGQDFTGSFVNFAPADGRDLTVFYKICLIDSDAGAADKDALLCAPSRDNFYYSFKAYAREDAKCMDITPNDSFDRAQTVSFDEWSFYQACAENKDYHALNVSPGQKVALAATFSKDADVSFKLYDKDRKEVPNKLSVSTCTGYAIAELEGPAAGQPTTYYLEIEASDLVYHISALELEAGQQVDCVDKALEPNNTSDKASPLKKGNQVTGLAICPDGSDKDIYTIDLVAGDKVEVAMNHNASAANLDLELYSPSQKGDEVGSVGAGVAYTFSIGKDDEVLTYDAQQCGSYKLMVFSNDGGADYSLTTNVTKSECQDADEFSCNHQLSKASLFEWDKSYTLQLCGKGEDWFKHKGFGASVLGELKVITGELADVKWEVYDINGTRVTEATRNGSTLDLDVSFPDDDFYYFRVSSSSPVTYDMLVVVP